jgi:hypothetical protein
MHLDNQRPGYLAYLLRIWRVEERGEIRWHAVLERPGDGKRFAFPTLEAAFGFLVECTENEREEAPVLPATDRRGTEAR